MTAEYEGQPAGAGMVHGCALCEKPAAYRARYKCERLGTTIPKMYCRDHVSDGWKSGARLFIALPAYRAWCKDNQPDEGHEQEPML